MVAVNNVEACDRDIGDGAASSESREGSTARVMKHRIPLSIEIVEIVCRVLG